MSQKNHRRYRRSDAIRSLVSETQLLVTDFIYPIFVSEKIEEPTPVPALKGVYQYPVSAAVEEAKSAFDLGVRSILLFGIPKQKDAQGTSAYDPSGGVQQAISAIKAALPELYVIADCCLCEYTDHGHCGILEGTASFDLEATLNALQLTAVSYATAGADCIAPSGMIDGMITAIREGLDSHHLGETAIMSYATKYASAFYGPFRYAAGSDGAFQGHRRFHQMSPTQAREGLSEAMSDVDQGADFLIVKPAAFYLDMVYRLNARQDLPIVAYHVSGVYQLMAAGSEQGIVDESAAFEELFISMKRAGASMIISYYAKEMAKRFRASDV